MFGKVKGIALENYGEGVVKYIGDYLVNVQGNEVVRKDKSGISDLSVFDCSLLWNIIVAPAAGCITKQLKDSAIDSLIRVIRHRPELINQYVATASSGITSGKDSRLILMKTLKKICTSAKGKVSSQKGVITGETLRQIVNSLLDYKTSVKGCVEAEELMSHVALCVRE